MATLMQLMQSAFSYKCVAEKKQERQDHFDLFCSSNFHNKFTIVFSDNIYHTKLTSCIFEGILIYLPRCNKHILPELTVIA